MIPFLIGMWCVFLMKAVPAWLDGNCRWHMNRDQRFIWAVFCGLVAITVSLAAL